MTENEIYNHITGKDKAGADWDVYSDNGEHSTSGFSYDEVVKVFKYAYNLALEDASGNTFKHLDIIKFTGGRQENTVIPKESILKLKIK